MQKEVCFPSAQVLAAVGDDQVFRFVLCSVFLARSIFVALKGRRTNNETNASQVFIPYFACKLLSQSKQIRLTEREELREQRSRKVTQASMMLVEAQRMTREAWRQLPYEYVYSRPSLPTSLTEESIEKTRTTTSIDKNKP